MKIKNKKILISSLILAAVALAIGGYYFFRASKDKKIVFSYDRYPKYQAKIAYLLNQEFEFISISPSDLSIALVDLNDDGIPEVIAYSLASGISGAGGGYTGIYSQTKSGLKLIWDQSLTDGDLAKSMHKTNGYHDLISYVIGWDPPYKSKDRKHTLAWVGPNGYDYVRSESVTDREREAYKHENL